MGHANYFDEENYKGQHIHLDNWEPIWAEAIAWKRVNETWDVFFYDFANESEYNSIFGNTQHYRDNVGGVFLFNVSSFEEGTEKFQKWCKEVLLPFRQKR